VLSQVRSRATTRCFMFYSNKNHTTTLQESQKAQSITWDGAAVVTWTICLAPSDVLFLKQRNSKTISDPACILASSTTSTPVYDLINIHTSTCLSILLYLERPNFPLSSCSAILAHWYNPSLSRQPSAIRSPWVSDAFWRTSLSNSSMRLSP